MTNKTNRIQYLLRIGVFLTFLGHGVFAIQGKQSWINYLEFIGFSNSIANKLIIFIGLLDIIVALIILLKPNKYIIIWAIFWTFSTALIRPITGESFWEFVERGANWITPLALYLLLYKNKNLL